MLFAAKINCSGAHQRMPMPEPKVQVSGWTNRHNAFLIVILLFAVVPRLALTLYNNQANDKHMPVVRLILLNDVSPGPDECWQCYQPKLFHWSAAQLIRAFELSDLDSQTRAAQFLNFVAALGSLTFIWLMILRLTPQPVPRLAVFALIALNPRFNGITAQATNDSFVILFGAATIYFLWLFLEQASWSRLFATTVSLILMSLAKTQGIVFIAMIVTVLGVRIAVGGASGFERRRQGLALGLLVVSCAATVPFLGPYYANYRDTGVAIASNVTRGPAAFLFEKTIYRRPGLRSIVDGYFTFRFLELVRRPYIFLDLCVLDVGTPKMRFDPRCTEHRTSFWTQLYARFHYLQYERWPASWKTDDPNILNTGRALMIVGLVPLAILILGVLIETRSLVAGLIRDGPSWLARNNHWVLLALFGGSLFVVIQFEYLIRDFSCVKIIYVFPALLAGAAIYLSGLEWLTARLSHRRFGMGAIWLLHSILIGLYILDVQWLVQQLRPPLV